MIFQVKRKRNSFIIYLKLKSLIIWVLTFTTLGRNHRRTLFSLIKHHNPKNIWHSKSKKTVLKFILLGVIKQSIKLLVV